MTEPAQKSAAPRFGHLRPADSLLTARHVADLCGVSTETVLRWTRAGKVPAIKLPSGQIRYRGEAVQEWLNERAFGTAA
jgi:excisionase family DNA binding protein